MYPDADIDMLPSAILPPPPDLSKESHKENLPPRRRTKKASAVVEQGEPIAWSADPKTQELQRKYMLKSTLVQPPPLPVTPKKTPSEVLHVTATPCRYHTRSSDREPTLTASEQKRRRYIMEAEADEKAGDL